LPSATDGSAGVPEDELGVALDRPGSYKIKLALWYFDNGFFGAVAEDEFADWGLQISATSYKSGGGVREQTYGCGA
jgi:hypothetical protein